MKFEISRHAYEEIGRREIPLNIVESVLHNPQQCDEYGNKRHISLYSIQEQVSYLVRVIVNENVDPAKVVWCIEQARS